MKRLSRRWALPKKESKVITDRKRTICTTVEPPLDRKDHFDQEPFKRTKQ